MSPVLRVVVRLLIASAIILFVVKLFTKFLFLKIVHLIKSSYFKSTTVLHKMISIDYLTHVPRSLIFKY